MRVSFPVVAMSPDSCVFSPQRILLVKTSSLGDVIHNLPVVGDLLAHFPDARIDWAVEESFAEIPRLHPGVHDVIPVALRRWRRRLFSVVTWREIGSLRKRLAATPYDAILDTQGLLKSALIARQAHGPHWGYPADCAREPLAARFYDAAFFVPKTLHAVERNRRLAAAAFGYSLPPQLDYGIPKNRADAASVVLLTATSRDDKLWPDAHWVGLGCALAKRGLAPLLPGGSPLERRRARDLAARIPGAQAIPPMNLGALADLLVHARLAVGVDTGLTHLAAATGVPTLALYTATEPGLTGVLGSGWFRNLGGKGVVPDVDQALAALAPVLSA